MYNNYRIVCLQSQACFYHAISLSSVRKITLPVATRRYTLLNRKLGTQQMVWACSVTTNHDQNQSAVKFLTTKHAQNHLLCPNFLLGKDKK